ncbi:MAG: PadR family transcriptional regulator [Gammaproteobacteria bacterium]|nr:PadR family transcriptional regulator [Gammaproteobacteria bacterium]
MDVKTVCLGMLTDGPASGYDLKKQFESTFAHFFAAGYGSIYPALSSLAEQGLVSCEEIPQEGKPDRKVYEITADGRAFLLEALQNPRPCHKVRSEFLATMCFAHLMPPEDIETVIDHRLHDIAMYQEMFRQFERECLAEWPEGQKFVLGFGKAVAKAMETYIRENRHVLTGQPAAKAATG